MIHKLALRTDAEAYLMPAPLYADTAKGKEIMTAQSGLAMTMDLIAEASLVVIGVGDCDLATGVYATTLAEADRASLEREGAKAELLGQFLNGAGARISTTLDDRVMAPKLDDLKGRRIVAVAGGAGKVAAIEAALRSGILTGLIIDEATARALVERTDDAAKTAAA